MDKFKKYYMSFGLFEKILIIIWLCLCLMITIISFVGFPEETEPGSITVFRISFYFLFTTFILIPAITIRNAKYAKNNSNGYSSISWPKTLGLAIFLGVFGGHRFYVKKHGSAVFYILTCGGFLVCWFTDIALILLGIFTDKNGNIVSRKKHEHSVDTVSAFKSNNNAENFYLQSDTNCYNENNLVFQTNPVKHGDYDFTFHVKNPIDQPEMKTDDSQSSLFTDIEMSGKTESRQNIPDYSPYWSFTNQFNSTGAGISTTAENVCDSTDFSDFYLDNSNYESRFFSDMKKFAGKDGHKATFVPFMQYWPRYSDMNRLQKAWYFFWRSEVRAGRYPNTDLSYIFLYIYELLSGVGWEQPSDGYQKLIEIWLNYRDSFPKLDSHLAGWSYDFAYKYKLEYNLPDALSDIVPGQQAVIDILIDRHSDDRPLRLNFKMAAALSDYNIYGSRFYNDGHQMLMAEVIPRVISLADAYLLKTKNKGILALYGPSRTRKQSYHAFSSALCPESNKLIHVEVKAYTSSSRLRKYVTGLIKFSENSLRKLYKYRGRVQNVEIDSETATLIESFIRTDYSPESASEHSDIGAGKHTSLTLDHEAIRKLREESDEVREALKVDTELFNSDEIEDTLNNTEYDGDAEQENEDAKSESCRFFKSKAMPENLNDLFSKFTAVQLKLIYLIICSDDPSTEIENLANEEMSMPDILIDEINDEASAALDDILIDTMGDKPCILDEYYNDIRDAVITEETV